MRLRLLVPAAVAAALLAGCGAPQPSVDGIAPACEKVWAAAKQASNTSQILLVQLRSDVKTLDPGKSYADADLIAGRFPGSTAPAVATVRQQLDAAVKQEMSTIVSQPTCFSSGERTMAQQALASTTSG